MNQLAPPLPPTVGGIRSLKNRLFASLMRIMLVAVLVCQVWAVKAQNLTVSINGGTPITGSSLEVAIGSTDKTTITSLEISAGKFTSADWEYLRANKAGLSKLTSFTITNGVSSVADMPDINTNSTLFSSSITTVSIDVSFAISRNAFYSCSNLTAISLPKATSIGVNTFAYCTALTTVSLPAATSIAGAAFANCTSLTTVNLPEATSIGESAFSNCTALTTVNIPKVCNIGIQAFIQCNALTTLSLPEVTNIGTGAFILCTALTTVELPVVKEIGIQAFQKCTSLTTINLPAVTKLKALAFKECTALTTVSLPVLPYYGGFVGNDPFEDCTSITLLELGAEPIVFIEHYFTASPTPRYVQLVDANGIPLTEPDLSKALEKFKADRMWDNNTNTWAGWRIEPFITVSYIVNEGGSIKGIATQRIAIGEITAEVEAVPSEGYRFVKWSDGVKTAKRFESNVQQDWNINAIFELIPTYTLTYTAGKGGSISGQATQIVQQGKNGTEVEAKPNGGYKFVKWSDDLTTAKRIDKNVQKDLEIAAIFELIPTSALTYIAGDGGSIRGQASQTVQQGQSGTEVEAVPNAGYRFVKWSDGLTTAKRTDTNVTANMSVTAEFEVIIYTLNYTAGENGSISGTTTQTVQHGQSGTEVEAKPNEGYKFVKWSDGVATAKRTDTNVQANLSVKAEFAKSSTTGLFDAQLDALSVFPNPTQGVLWVSVPELAEGTAAEVLVYNAAGQLLQRVPAHGASAGSAASRLSIDLSGSPAGMYIIRVGNAVAKVVKQ